MTARVGDVRWKQWELSSLGDGTHTNINGSSVQNITPHNSLYSQAAYLEPTAIFLQNTECSQMHA